MAGEAERPFSGACAVAGYDQDASLVVAVGELCCEQEVCAVVLAGYVLGGGDEVPALREAGGS